MSLFTSILQVHDAQDEVHKQLAENSKARSRADALEVKNESLEDDLKGAKSSIDALKAEIAKLKEQVAASEATLNAEKEASYRKIAAAESAKSSAEIEQKSWYINAMT
jgi:sirohydrochlorin ferrochelatase